MDDKVILIGPKLRIPKSYFRFEGIMMKLFKEKIIKNKEGDKTLLELHENATFNHLIKNVIGSDKVVGLTSVGARSTAGEVVLKSYIDNRNIDCTFVIGGFPKGHFSECTSKLFSCSYSIVQYAVESHIVIARILYECEKILLFADKSKR
jgi:rRNA small subunit pseudouridine methyltransferase Nep1